MTITYANYPDDKGHFGDFGGKFASETLMHCLEELKEAYSKFKNDPEFQQRFQNDLADYVGRPSPLYLAERLTAQMGGAKIWLKREDLNHTGAHKINNTIGQILLAKAMGKKRIIAETGAGQHGVATAKVIRLAPMIEVSERGMLSPPFEGWEYEAFVASGATLIRSSDQARFSVFRFLL